MSIKNTSSTSTSSSSGSKTISGSQVEVGGSEILIDQVFAAGSTNAPLAVAFNYLDLQSFTLVSDKNLTIEFNNSTTGVPTINLIANDPFIWHKSSGYFANPFTANVTQAFVTCSQAASLIGKILVT